MINNRRTYYFHPARIDEGLQLIPELVEITHEVAGRNFKVMTSLYGPISVIVFDMRFIDDADMNSFSDVWYPPLWDRGFIDRWFINVKQMTSELWSVEIDQTRDSASKHNAIKEDYWRPITNRLVMQPYASSYRSAVSAIQQIKEKTLTEFQKEVIFSQTYLGASNQLALEIDHESVAESERFTHEWMKCLKAEKLFESLFENIQHGESEIWQAVNEYGKNARKRKENIDVHGSL